MGGIPNDPTCSICESLRTIPPSGTNKSILDIKVAWCVMHERKLFLLQKYVFPDPNPEPSISSTVCSRFKSVYKLPDEKNRTWPPSSGIRNGHEYLWLTRPSNEKPYRIFKPLIRLDELPKVNPVTGDVVEY